MIDAQGYASFILRNRAWVSGALVLLTLIALAGIYDPIRGVPRIRIDPSLNEMLPAEDEARQFYEELLERFGSDDVVLVVLESDSLFTPEGLAALVETSEALESAPGVHHLESLATALRLRPVDGDIEIDGYLDSLPNSRAEASRLRDQVLADPLRAGSLVSKDARATGLLVTFERIPEDEFLAQNLDLAVLETARRHAPDMRVYLAGTPHIKAEVGRLMTAELTRMVPIVFVLMSALSCFFFRSIRLGLIPLSAVVLGLIWTVGTMGWVGHDLNIVTTLIPPLILCLGFAYATHVVASFQSDSEASEKTGQGLHGRARRALSSVTFPVTFTALTTAVGFLSLISNGLEVIQGFGFFAAVSTVATLIAALTVVPLLLSVAERRGGQGTEVAESRRLDRFFAGVARFDRRNSTAILMVAGLGVAVALVGAMRIEVNLPVIENFRPDAPIRIAYQDVDRLFGGANQFYVMLRAEEQGAFESPELLSEVDALQDWLVAQPEIGGATSVVQYLEVLNEALGSEVEPTRALPKTSNGVAQLLLFGGNEELDVLIDRAHQVITILVRSTTTETSEFNRLAKRIDSRLGELPENISGYTTGNAILLTRAADRIASGQAKSLILACGMIGLLLVLYFRSLRLGLIALIPNVVPVILYFGLLGWFGITLNNSTALMGSIVLGIAVDDTLHLIVEYRRQLARGNDSAEALRFALEHVGRAITCTTLAICLGLLVIGGSDLRNQAEFGFLGAATLAIAWIVDVTFTPALCWRLLKSPGARSDAAGEASLA